MNPATSKTRSKTRPRASSVRDAEDLARKQEGGRRPSRSAALLRWLRAKISEAAGRVRTWAKASARTVRTLWSRTAGWVRDEISSPVRLMKSLFMDTIGKDRGFVFWWLVVTVAISLIIGLLVAALLSPVIGILAALIVGIWMLVRRNRSSQSRKTANANLAS